MKMFKVMHFFGWYTDNVSLVGLERGISSSVDFVVET